MHCHVHGWLASADFMLFGNAAHKQQMAVQPAYDHNPGAVEVMMQAHCYRQTAVNETFCSKPTLSFMLQHWAEHTKHDPNIA